MSVLLCIIQLFLTLQRHHHLFLTLKMTMRSTNTYSLTFRGIFFLTLTRIPCNTISRAGIKTRPSLTWFPLPACHNKGRVGSHAHYVSVYFGSNIWQDIIAQSRQVYVRVMDEGEADKNRYS